VSEQNGAVGVEHSKHSSLIKCGAPVFWQNLAAGVLQHVSLTSTNRRLLFSPSLFTRVRALDAGEGVLSSGEPAAGESPGTRAIL
jgi:hypothetical protein